MRNLLYLKALINKTTTTMTQQAKFYAPSYLEQKYGKKKAKKIEKAIDEVLGENGWDVFTSLNSEKEVENFIEGLVD